MEVQTMARKENLSAAAALVIACFSSLYAFSSDSLKDPEISPAAAGSRDTNPTRIRDLMPPDERQFITALEESANAGQADAKAGRAKTICEISPSLRPLGGWVGRMVSLAAGPDGKAALTLQIGADTYVGTGSSAASSDAADVILITPDKPLFAKLSQFRRGQWLRFFGEFAKNDAGCVKETSASPDSAAIRPEFIFRFTDVFPL
jgi:hypothetical protein